MAELSYRRHRFPPVVIQHAVWLYLRFTLSYRDVEDLLAERGLDISYETIRSWVLKFGPVIARRLRRRRPRPSNRWHLDEMVVRIAGERFYLWRAVDEQVLSMNAEAEQQRSVAVIDIPFGAIAGAREVDRREDWSETGYPPCG
jgi:putative transposase